jgi:hypothetical protein
MAGLRIPAGFLDASGPKRSLWSSTGLNTQLPFVECLYAGFSPAPPYGTACNMPIHRNTWYASDIPNRRGKRVIRRLLRSISILLLFFPFLHTLSAQVYPEREELDVVRLVDGTVLKGVILEEVPERYLEIELYGGSTFVLGSEQIESVEREPNPDYGTTWIKIDLGDLDAAIAGTTANATPGDARPRPLSAGGHMVGVYSFGLIPALIVDSNRIGGFSAEDWDGNLPDTDNDIEDPNMQYRDRSVHGGVAGLSYTWWTPFENTERTLWMWGTRASTGYHATYSGLEERNRSTEPRDIKLDVEAHFVPVFAEGLIGIAGDRAALFGGFGLGLGLTYLRADYGYYLDYSDDTFVDGDTNLTVRHPVTPLYSASLTGLFRLGRRWVLEAGLWANGQFVSAFEEGFVFRGWGERIAIGYRFGGRDG